MKKLGVIAVLLIIVLWLTQATCEAANSCPSNWVSSSSECYSSSACSNRVACSDKRCVNTVAECGTCLYCYDKQQYCNQQECVPNVNSCDGVRYFDTYTECINTQKCSDGTPVGQCSTEKPYDCIKDSQGTIRRVMDCNECGCPSGSTCNTATEECSTPNTNTCQSNGYFCHYPSCLSGYTQVSLTGCSSNYACCKQNTPNTAYNCYEGDVWWYDSGGVRTSIKESCDTYCDDDDKTLNVGSCSNKKCVYTTEGSEVK